jgi:enterochelin esterase family protein
MQRLGTTNVYALAMDMPNFTAACYQYEIDGKRISTSNRDGVDWLIIEHYTPDPDNFQQPGVPQGKLTKYHWKSEIFPETERDYWVYIPAQYKPDGPPACLMVFQDGGMYVGDPVSYMSTYVPTVFDNLIHKGDMPVTVGVFINPGVINQEGKNPESNRDFEYHEMSDQYARFLRDEIIPEVSKSVNLRKDAVSHAICGISSGALCAFTAAWEMPELFSKVLCHVGSFPLTVITGGKSYWRLIRITPKKPIRVYLQDGSNDIDDICGNWPLANQEMAAALKFAGYDYKFDYGRGFHNLLHGGATLPQSLCWLWRDYKAE